MTIEFKEYNLLGNLQDEEDALWSFENEFSGSTYLGDAISEIADNHVPIYTDDIWEFVKDIQEYVEEAVAQGLAETSSGDFDLTSLFSAGYYQFYIQSLYDNLDTMIYNIIAFGVNEYIVGLDEEFASSLDIGDIKDEIELLSENIDNNDTFSAIEDAVDVLKQRIEDGEFGFVGEVIE